MSSQNERLQRVIEASPIWEVLPAIAQQELPDWWLAGGAVRNTVWKALFGERCHLGVKDYDIAFFDAKGDREQELAAKHRLQELFPERMFDVKNQASFAVWRPGWKVFSSTEDGISNWLHTATATGVRLNRDGQLEIFAPYGLDDLFSGIVRPTPLLTESEAAFAKAQEFFSKCSLLVAP